MISTDRDIFREGSEARERMIEYGSLVRELHIIVFSKKSLKLKSGQIGENLWLYPTSSFSRSMYIFDAVKMGKRLFFINADVNVLGEKIGIEESLADLVTTQDPFECGLAGWFIATALRVPLHIQIHTDFLSVFFAAESLLNKIRVQLAKFLLRRESGGIRVVSQRIKDSISEKMKFAYGKFPPIAVLPIFVDIEKLKNTVPAFDLREKFPEFSHIVLVASRLEKEKGVDVGLEIFATLPESKLQTAGLVIAGAGSEQKNLKKLAEKLGIGERVVFLGLLSFDELVSCYKTADLLLVTSRYEGYGRQIVEASASGCPILSFDVGVAPEVLTYWNGSICPTLDSKCMEKALSEWFAEKDTKDTLLFTAHAKAEKIVGISKEEYLAKYQKIWENAALTEKE